MITLLISSSMVSLPSIHSHNLNFINIFARNVCLFVKQLACRLKWRHKFKTSFQKNKTIMWQGYFLHSASNTSHSVTADKQTTSANICSPTQHSWWFINVSVHLAWPTSYWLISTSHLQSFADRRWTSPTGKSVVADKYSQQCAEIPERVCVAQFILFYNVSKHLLLK
jgi:hypothetical protein